MDDQRNTQGKKVMIAVFVAILVLLCMGLCIGAYALYRTRLQSAAPPQQLLPTSVNLPLSGANNYLPVIALEVSTGQVEMGPILEAQPTQTSTDTPSNLWRVTQIYPQSYSRSGYVYDLAVFENVTTGESIKAFCAEPGWPGPNVGDLFIRNEWNVLVPTQNDSPPWIQRFIVIDP
jgi:hypothetical protein